LIGGARHTAFEAEATTEVSTTAFIQEKLESYAQKHVLPENQPYTITHRWSGIMGMGSTKFPIVERVSDQLFVCARMSGMGVALAPVVTERAIKLMEDAEKS
jgi:glycine/D-amino acid oxidase-like deaminating enzyme